MELRLGLFDRGSRLFILSRGVVQVLLRQRVLRRKRLSLVQIGFGNLQRGLIALRRSRLRIHLGLERLRVHLEQH